MFWLKSEPILRKTPTLTFSPPQQAAGRKNPSARGRKISSPKTPPFFARSPEKFSNYLELF